MEERLKDVLEAVKIWLRKFGSRKFGFSRLNIRQIAVLLARPVKVMCIRRSRTTCSLQLATPHHSGCTTAC
jgi:hypothetical protein